MCSGCFPDVFLFVVLLVFEVDESSSMFIGQKCQKGTSGVCAGTFVFHFPLWATMLGVENSAPHTSWSGV